MKWKIQWTIYTNLHSVFDSCTLVDGIHLSDLQISIFKQFLGYLVRMLSQYPYILLILEERHPCESSVNKKEGGILIFVDKSIHTENSSVFAIHSSFSSVHWWSLGLLESLGIRIYISAHCFGVGKILS